MSLKANIVSRLIDRARACRSLADERGDAERRRLHGKASTYEHAAEIVEIEFSMWRDRVEGRGSEDHEEPQAKA